MESCGATPVRIVLALTIAICLLSAGCNRPPKGDVTVVGGDGSSTTTVVVPPGTPPPAPADPVVPTVTNDETTGKTAGSGPVSGKVEVADLSGKWLALFGRSAGGSVDEAWKRYEVVEFRRSGELIWTKKEGESIPYNFTLNGLQLEMQPGVKNVGRDDEVGLMNVGRDDEVGLNKADAAKGKSASGGLKKHVFRDGNFLALIGDDNDIMVFGKVGDTENTNRPEVKGKYTAKLAKLDSLPANFEWNNNILLGHIGEGKGTFKAEFKDGYFVGVSNGPWGNGYGAVAVQPDGSLDGVSLPMPFNAMNADFDFKPGQ